MPQPNAHYLVVEAALKDHPSGLWNKYSNFAGFGSFGPDLFYVLGIPPVMHRRKYPTDYTSVSDAMHHEASLDFFCSMLDDIKNGIKERSKETTDKLKAFAYGYYSHAVTDSVFHPYVYRRTGDNWAVHFTDEYKSHKKLEALIDTCLLERIKEKNPFDFEYEARVVCHTPNSKRTLDKDVYEIIKNNIKKIYGDKNIFGRNGIEFEKYFGHGIEEAASEGIHPILEAYRDYIHCFRILYLSSKMDSIAGLLHPTLKPLIPIKNLDDKQRKQLESRRKWRISENPLMPDYSVPELFEFAVKAAKRVIDVSEEFFASDSASSRDFFANKLHASSQARKIVYLDEDYNLDTGLPSSNNALIWSATPKEVSEFGLGKLQDNYRTIGSYKNPSLN